MGGSMGLWGAKILYCEDLVNLGIDETLGVSILNHDHRYQAPDDWHCDCWKENPNPIQEYGETFWHEEYDSQWCECPTVIKIDDDLYVSLCCLCADKIRDAKGGPFYKHGDFCSLIDWVRIKTKDDNSGTTSRT